MNTAPKLHEQHIMTLREMLNTHLNEPQSKEAKALKAAISAIAPPSGEGVDYELIAEMLGDLVYDDGYGMKSHSQYTVEAIKQQIDALNATTPKSVPGGRKFVEEAQTPPSKRKLSVSSRSR